MLSKTFSACLRCRPSLVDSNIWRRGIQTSSVLQRKDQGRPLREKHGQHSRPKNLKLTHTSEKTRHFTKPRDDGMQNRTIPSPDSTRKKLQEGTLYWSHAPSTLDRLKAMGLEQEHATQLLNIFVKEMPEDGYFPPEEDDRWQMQRIQDEMVDSLRDSIDRALTRRFMAWALTTLRTRGVFPPSVYTTLSLIQSSIDFSHPEEWFPTARMLRRKIHMHVGPTNSGKTHNALRALAASKHGVYASPLRLLAYEVFERLNNGHIVPLGADPSASPETFKRQCNLLTGEDIRTVNLDAPLLSCTVEMIDVNKRYEVAVVDEVQMVSDPARGGAWAQAILGLHAAEVHLCGEEGAVPLVQKMLQEVGDEVIVHRYERLTPLKVASESLKGDLKKIQKGDCVVAFSRSRLFELKKEIEQATGMRCAMIYGRLPPEVRSEQAGKFNDPSSKYDVLIGSDAIGMGLNLKIKRIVFENSMKWDGFQEKTLSLSQLKQIAGRAGRFGLHGDDVVGTVTSLHDRDLDAVRKAVETPSIPFQKRAVLPTTEQMLHKVEQLIQPRANFEKAFDIMVHAAVIPPIYTLRDFVKANAEVVPIIDTLCKDYTLLERIRIMLAPILWRDPLVRKAAENMLNMYSTQINVRLRKSCEGTGLFEALEEIQSLQAEPASPSPVKPSSKSKHNPNSDKDQPGPIPGMDSLIKLESLYRVVVVYLWFSMRLPIVFYQRELATQMKVDIEIAIDWALQRTRAAKQKKFSKKFEGKKTEIDTRTVGKSLHNHPHAPKHKRIKAPRAA